ncbi:MAG TPA: HAD-IIB family hydrolase [Trichocoleus sp.]
MPDFQALSSPAFAKLRSHLRLVATDLDGTLTQNGQFTPLLLQGLQDLQGAGLPVLLVTGRSAGWVSALVEYLPVAGAIAENGGLFFAGGNAAPILLSKIRDLSHHRQALAELFGQLQSQRPHLQESTDNRYRLSDWTFDVAGLSQEDLDDLAATTAAAGWGFTYSTVQCHLKLPQQSKASALLQVLADHFPDLTPDQVVTVGDSPNDESLFDPATFPNSVGVANIQHYWPQLQHQPVYVTQTAEAQGFLELSRALTEVRSRRMLED